MASRALAILLLLASAGCYDPEVAARVACGKNGECPGDQRCVAKICGGELPDASIADADLGPFELTVLRVGPAPGRVATVSSVTAGIDCGTECVHSFDATTQVTLRVTLQNGSNLRFAGWRGDCAGIDIECQLSMDGNREVTAEFADITHNLAFVTRDTTGLRLRSRWNFDSECNLAATSAGLNNLAGDGFRAWVSDPTFGAATEVIGANGWVRMDGLPFSDTRDDLLTGHIFNPLNLDQGGREVLGQIVTATAPAGSFSGNNCMNWHSGGMLTLGQSTGGPVTWTAYVEPACDTITRGRLYCLQRTLSATLVLTPRPSPSKRLFVTRGSFTPGSGGLAEADSLCGREAVGVAPFKALLARGGRPAGAMLDPAMSYYTMSEQLIGSGRELLDGVRLHSGIWQHSDASFLVAPTVAERQVRTGSARPSESVQDCGNWEGSSGSTPTGLATDTVTWWATPFSDPCSTPMRLYCVEQ